MRGRGREGEGDYGVGVGGVCHFGPQGGAGGETALLRMDKSGCSGVVSISVEAAVLGLPGPRS